jgi:hypothetical protein
VSAVAGTVVTEMKTPIRAAARASVSDTTPTIPAKTVTITENRFGLTIRLETGAHQAGMPGACCRTSEGLQLAERGVAVSPSRGSGEHDHVGDA